MVSYVELKGFDAFSKYTETIDLNGQPVFFYFSGAKLPSGESWCPDCVEEFKKSSETLPERVEFALKRLKTTQVNPRVTELSPHYILKPLSAEPVVKAYLSELNKSVIFAYVDVGDRDYWKDKACPFRTDARTKLMVIPTIIKWKGVQRLEGSQCNKRELLQMLFEEED